MPEPNCACAAGCNVAPIPMASYGENHFLHGLSFRLAVGAPVLAQRYALLLCSKNLVSGFARRLASGLHLASRSFSSYEFGHLLCGQLFSPVSIRAEAGGLIEATLWQRPVFALYWF